MTEDNGKSSEPEKQAAGKGDVDVAEAKAGEATTADKIGEEAITTRGREQGQGQGQSQGRAQGPPRAKGLRIAFLVMCLVGLAASVELIRLHVKAHTRPSERSFCSVHSKVDCLSVAESPWAVFLGVPVAAWATLAFMVLIAGTVVVLARQWRRGAVGVVGAPGGQGAPQGAEAGKGAEAGNGAPQGAEAGKGAEAGNGAPQAAEGGQGAKGGSGAARGEEPGDTLAGLTFVLSLGAVGVAALMAYVSHVIIGSLCLVCAALYVVNTTLAVLAWRITARHGGVVRALGADLAAVRRRWGTWALIAAAGLVAAGTMMAAYPAYWRFTGPVGPGDLAHGTTEDGHPWIGAREPQLIVHEFSDYECGFCRRYNAMLRELLRKGDLGSKVRVVHYHYPLDRRCNRTVPQEFHLRACELARAAYCAGKQGKFWHMHDGLYARMRPGGPAVLGLAGKLGLDQRSFRQCLESAEARAKIKKDIELGEQMSYRVAGRGINGTPTYFLQRPGQEPRAAMPNERSLRLALEQIPQHFGPGGLAHGVTVEGAAWIGAREPAVTLYEASDYNCFFCLRGHFLTRELLKDPAIGHQVRLVHLQYPFDSECNPAFKDRQHPRACGLARAALCAKTQGKFWEMNDLIFRASAAGRIPSLPVLGHRLRLHRPSYAACLASPEVKAALDAEIQQAERLGALDKKGIDGIPTVFFKVGPGPIRRREGRVERDWLLGLLGLVKQGDTATSQ